MKCVVWGKKAISTHTLTWSVTPLLIRISRNFLISTHTLTWSVTQTWETEKDGKTISTHTLTWSVTEKVIRIMTHERFQLTRSRGA